jgi:ABC-type polysaccharide/polyol phosphate export permease
LRLNPVVTFLELIREPILYGNMPIVWAWSKAAIVVAMFGSMALGVIARWEKKLIFHL